MYKTLYSFKVIFFLLLFNCGWSQVLYVTSVAGNGATSSMNGPTPLTSSFNVPRGFVYDSAGNLFIAESGANMIRKITPAGVVSFFAGDGSFGDIDDPGNVASFRVPIDIAIDAMDNLYVTDSSNGSIRKITSTGVVSTFATLSGGTPYGIAIDALGNLYVSDISYHNIKKITPSGVVTTIAGGIGTTGSTDGNGTNARFNEPSGLAFDILGNLYIADSNNHRIRKLTPAGDVTTVAGTSQGYTNGNGNVAQFNNPNGIAIDIEGTIYVADTNNNRIRKITNAGVVSNYAGTGGFGAFDAPLDSSNFGGPFKLKLNTSTNKLIIGDTGNNKIRQAEVNPIVGLVIYTSKTDIIGCPGNANGTAVVSTVANGTAPYTYTWSSAVAGFVPPANTVSNLTALTAGTYTCLVRDSSNPIQEKTVTFVINDANVAYDAYIKADATCSTNNLTIEPVPFKLISNNFTTNSGFTLSGNASYSSANGNVMLVPDLPSQNGKMLLDLPATIPADFEATFRVYMKDKQGADGFSFNIGSEIPGMTEDGTNVGLALRFKTYITERLSATWNGTQIGTELSFGTDRVLQLGKWNDIKVRVVAGKLSFFINGNPVVLDTAIPGYAMNNSYKAIFAGRCGGVSNEILIDDFVFGNPTYEYSIDGTNYQTSNVFTNVVLPTNYTLPIWLRQNGCAIKVRDYVYPVTKLPSTLTATTTGCSPSTINVALPSTHKIKVYENDFSTKNGYILGGDAKNTANGILLNKDQRYARGYMIIDKPAAIDKKMEMIVKHQSLNKIGADGFSISYGNPDPIINNTTVYENGVSTGLAIRFKTFGQDNLSVFYNNTQYGVDYTTATNGGVLNFESGNENTVRFLINENYSLFVWVNDILVVNNVSLPGFENVDTSNYKFIIAARSGGVYNENLIKNVSITNNDGLEYSKNNSTTYTTLYSLSVINNSIAITPADYPTGIVNLNIRLIGSSCPVANSPLAVTAANPPIATFTQNGNVLTANETNPNATFRWIKNCPSATSYLPENIVGTSSSYTVETTNNYLLEVTLNGCMAESICTSITVLAAPTATDQTFCSGATVANLIANPSTGNTIKWYNVATGGTALTNTTLLVSGNYYASQTNGTSESTRTAITVTINPTPSAPTANAQSFCGSATVSNLTATAASGNTLNWYNVATGGTAISNSTALASGTYYVSQTNGTCESTRTAVTVTVSSTPSAPTANAQQTYCNDFFVSDLEATATSGNTLRWYNVATGGTPLAGSTSLVAGTYYVSQINGTCEKPRTAVQVTLVPYPAAPTANAQSLCSGARVSDLVATGESGNTLFWYNSATATNSLAPFTLLSTGTYYVEQLNSASCNSPRTAVSVTINSIPSAPTGNSSQTFVNGATIANLVVSPANVTWFANLTDAQNGTNPLATTTQLVNNSTYYAVITENGCRSNSFGVTVSLTLSNSNFELEQKVKLYPNPTSSIINIDLGDIQNATAKVYDLNGRELQTATIGTTATIDIANYAKGIYLLKLVTDKGTLTKQIIKE